PHSFSSCSAPLVYLHSFPTRRSSDLFAPALNRYGVLRGWTLEHLFIVTSGGTLAVAVLAFLYRTALLTWHNEIVARISGTYFREDRKSTRLNSSHVSISYAVFCLKKK